MTSIITCVSNSLSPGSKTQRLTVSEPSLKASWCAEVNRILHSSLCKTACINQSMCGGEEKRF